MVIQEVRLNAVNYGVPPVVHAVQADRARHLRMYVDDLDVSDIQDGMLCYIRPDGTGGWVAAHQHLEDGIEDAFRADITNALIVDGRVECQLKLDDSSGYTVSTFTFYIDVEKGIRGL